MTCIGPIPDHLRHYGWYAPHQAWLRESGQRHHYPGGAEPKRASLAGEDLSSADLHRAVLTGADLTDADLIGADLYRAVLTGANLDGANLDRADLIGAVLAGADLALAELTDANLTGVTLTGADLRAADLTCAHLYRADLTGAVLTRAYLYSADLTGADLTRADLTGATLNHADLTSATLPDGRTLEEWRLDPLAGLCTDPESVARAAAAWGGRSWRDCPLHEGMGVSGLDEIEDADTRLLAATFVALLDGEHLPQPPETP